MILLCLSLALITSTAVSERSNVKKPLETFEIDLDTDPKLRWTDVVKQKKDDILLLLDALDILIGGDDADELIAATNASLTGEYRQEMEGIASTIGTSFERVLMANIYYEISGVGSSSLDLSRSCTSIVVVNRKNKTVYLARNQDYPPPFELVEIHAVFKRNGNTTVYEGTTFAGTIGLATATKPGGWAVSINARANILKGTKDALPTAVANARTGGSIFPLITREALEEAETFDDAMHYLSSKAMIMEGYIIVGGIAPSQGAIVTRNASGAETNILWMDGTEHDGGGGDWYVVQTNTDHWRDAPSYPGYKNTSRRGTATRSLDTIGTENIGVDALFGVLSTPPVRNFATIHTDFAIPETDLYETYKIHGPL